MDYQTSAMNVGSYNEPWKGQYRGFSLQNNGTPESIMSGLRDFGGDNERVYRHELAHAYDPRMTPWMPKVNWAGKIGKSNMTTDQGEAYRSLLGDKMDPYVADREAPAVLAENNFVAMNRPNPNEEKETALRALLKSKAFINSKNRINVTDFRKIDTDPRWFE